MDALARLTASLPTLLPTGAAGLQAQMDAALPKEDVDAELGPVFQEAASARACGVGLDEAVQDDASWPALAAFHRGLKDALFVELPRPLVHWIQAHREGETSRETTASLGEVSGWMHGLVDLARRRGQSGGSSLEEVHLDTAAAELLLFEMVRLRLLLAAWNSTDYESVGGDEATIDAIAWREVDLALDAEWLESADVHPGRIMTASAAIMLNADAIDRALELEHAREDTREHLRMQARLRGALRELRLPESRLLENALANLLDTPRLDLLDLQARHPVALEDLSRQAMDQRVSRGRRALGQDASRWPARKAPALYDLFREPVERSEVGDGDSATHA